MAKKNQGAEAVRPSSEETDSDETSSDEEEEDSPSTDKKSTAQKEPPEPAADETLDSGSESEDSVSDSPVKLIASKSMDDGSKLRKPRSKPNSKRNSATKTPAKRVAVAEGEKESKKSKTEKGEGGGGEEEGKKSVLFQRLWSDDDEIVILTGMLEYKEKKGADPMADANGFHDFIKKSLRVDVDRRQLVSKVRRLKKRYENSLGKRKTLNPHEKNVLELSKKIWGNHMESADLDQQSKSTMKTRKISKAAAAAAASKGGGNDGMASPARNGSVANYDGKMEGGNFAQFIGKSSVSMGLDESIVKVGLELCKEDGKAQIEEKWRKLHLEESDLFLRKLDLVRQESEMIIAAIRSGVN